MAMPTLIKAWISRALPQAILDNGPDYVRGGRYGDLYVLPSVRKQHLLADEGSYYVYGNGQTAITGQTDTAFAATHPTLYIYNTDSPTNLNNKRVHLDYLYLLNGGTAFSNATSNTGTFVAVVVDNGDRGASGGADLTTSIVSPNMDASGKASVARVRFGAVTVSAATAAARTIVGQRLLRAPVSGTALTLANLDQFQMNFGGVEPNMSLPNAASPTLEANVVGRILHLPPVIVGPNQCALVYVFSVSGGAVTAGNFLPEGGMWER